MPYRILLVDDDGSFRKEFKEAFSEYVVIESSSGDEAIRLLKKPHEIDVVVLDVKMPGIDGIEVLKEIKKTDPAISIVILTGFSSEDIAINALKAHADDYLEKPIDVEEAKDVIGNILSAKEGYQEDSGDIDWKIKKVVTLLERNRFKRFSLEDAASSVGVSSKYLSRIFKKKTGTSFNDLRLKLKMSEAPRLLSEAKYTVSQIADKLGYDNCVSFMRIFKKKNKMTPTDFRRRRKKNQRNLRKK